jgi:hypothetical protein
LDHTQTPHKENIYTKNDVKGGDILFLRDFMAADPPLGGERGIEKGGVFAVHIRGLPVRAYPQERLRSERRLVLDQQEKLEQTAERSETDCLEETARRANAKRESNTPYEQN